MNKERREGQKLRVAEKEKKAEIVVHAINRGATAKDALLEAGYSETTALKHAKKILKGRYIREAVIRVGEAITSKSLSAMAKFRLQDLLLDPKADVRVLVQGIRMSLETNAEIGANANIFLQQNNFAPPPPQAAAMMAETMRELRNKDLASGEVGQGSPSDLARAADIAQMEAIGAPYVEAKDAADKHMAQVRERNSRPIELHSADGRTFA